MAESTLNLTADSLKALIGWKIGAGRTSGNWTTNQIANISAVLDAGLRLYYWPMNGYRWTFLNPFASLTTVIGTRTYSLPDDFGSILGNFQFPLGTTQPARAILVVDPEFMRRWRAGFNAEQNGKPLQCCITTAAPTSGKANRYTVEFDRPFDAIYILQYQYAVQPGSITTSGYAYGQAQFSDLLVASCMAAAEWQLFNEQGIEYQRYTDCLAAAVKHDAMNQPRRIGPYGDDVSISANSLNNGQSLGKQYYKGVEIGL